MKELQVVEEKLKQTEEALASALSKGDSNEIEAVMMSADAKGTKKKEQG